MPKSYVSHTINIGYTNRWLSTVKITNKIKLIPICTLSNIYGLKNGFFMGYASMCEPSPISSLLIYSLRGMYALLLTPIFFRLKSKYHLLLQFSENFSVVYYSRSLDIVFLLVPFCMHLYLFKHFAVYSFEMNLNPTLI